MLNIFDSVLMATVVGPERPSILPWAVRGTTFEGGMFTVDSPPNTVGID